MFLLFTGAALQSSARQVSDSLARHYYRMASSSDPEERKQLTEIIYQLIKGSKESDWLVAWHCFAAMKQKAAADSMEVAIRIRFPAGIYWMEKEVSSVYDADGAAAKETAYNKWIQKYPAAAFATESIVYDYAAHDVGSTYAREKSVQKALYYAEKMQTDVWKGEGWAGIGTALEKGGFIKEATLLFQRAMNNAYLFTTSRSGEEGAAFAANGYRAYCELFAGGLLELQLYDSALVYIQKAAALTREPLISVNYKYAEILTALGRDKEAYDKADAIMQLGLGDDALKALHRKLYNRLNAGGKDYDSYMAALEEANTKRVIDNLGNTMVNQPGQAFELRDVEGNKVASAQLAGKTVVLDFWATWCTPCKKSFPAMQMAVNQFKEDTSVVFLFIHTWERGEGNATADARKYINDNHYTFRVLMDLKDETSGTNKLVSSYGISGIPTKMVIDGKGRVRFRITGFSGSNEAAVKELSAMIALAKKAASGS